MKYITSPYLRKTRIESRQDSNEIFNAYIFRNQFVGNEEMAVLKYCKNERPLQTLYDIFGCSVVDNLIRKHCLFEYNSQWACCAPVYVEIETSTICNWKCKYCPVKDHERSIRFIDPSLFSEIITQASHVPSIRRMAIHAYNEPLIDPNFNFYVEHIVGHGFVLELHTNGSLLNEEKIQFMRRYKQQIGVVVNIPSVDPAIFKDMTEYYSPEPTIRAIELCSLNEIPVVITVEGQGQSHIKETQKICQRFPEIPVTSYESNDRAGLLKSDFYQDIHINDKKLFGCSMIMEAIRISIDGDFYICWNDFYKKHTYGNIADKSFLQILSGEEASHLRKQVMGAVSADENFICRNCIGMKISKTQYGKI